MTVVELGNRGGFPDADDLSLGELEDLEEDP